MAAWIAVSCGGGDESATPPPSNGGTGGDSGSGGSAGTAGGSTGGTGAKDGGAGNGAQCGVCTLDKDCATGFKCIPAPLGDLFCAKDCASESCPSGDYECVDLAEYGRPDAGTAGSGPDASNDTGSGGAAGEASTEGGSEAGQDAASDGSSDSSLGGAAGAAGAAGAGGAGGTGGAPSTGGSAGAAGAGPQGKVCVPTKSASCPCIASRTGVKRNCFNENSFGKCTGKETCQSNAWQGCDAPAASKEICDNKDNNCNGFTDMDEPGITGNQLCSSGQAPPHSGFTCAAGECQLAGCEPGWTKYPPSTPASEGCNCAIDPPDITATKNDECANATDKGSLSDVGSTPVTIQGTLATDSDVDWYGIVMKDQNEVPIPNSYRVHVEFVAADGNPGDQYRFDIVRTDGKTPCDTAGLKTELTSYDWCADVTTDPTKPGNADSTATYRIRVFRKAGAAGDCKPYKLKLSNGGGTGSCPADDGCGQ
ncbi:MAG: hypothetical protein HY898_26595 [Deltaproteobacteria bacterium]|nr:hypothetical protein [Deltaproteobacteria bacterium]